MPCHGKLPFTSLYITLSSGSYLLSLDNLPSSRVVDMDLIQFLAFLFILLLSGTGVTGTLRTSLDPSLEICILWVEGGVNELCLKSLINEFSLYPQSLGGIPGMEQQMGTGEKM